MTDGGAAVGLDHDVRVGPPTGDAFEHLLDDGQRVLVPRIVRREERPIAQLRCRRAHERALGPVAIPATAEDTEHPAGAGKPARLTEHDLQPGRRVGVVDQHREGRAIGVRLASGSGDDLQPARDRIEMRHRPRDLDRSEIQLVEGQCGLRSEEGVVDVDRTRQRGDDPLPAPRERRVAGAQHDVGGITVVHGDGGDAGAIEQALPPGVVGVHDAAQRMARREEQRLGLEVLLHRPVVVQVVVAQVGEDRHVEMDALDPGLDQRVARHLHGDRMTMAVGLLAVAHTGQHALHLGGLGGGPCPGQRPHHVRRTTGRAQQVAQQLGHRRLPVGPRHTDHQQVAGGVAVEGRRQPGHDRAHGPGRRSGSAPRPGRSARG